MGNRVADHGEPLNFCLRHATNLGMHRDSSKDFVLTVAGSLDY